MCCSESHTSLLQHDICLCQSVCAVQISRMMFNIRGLVIDDPYGTKEINLPTLDFVTPIQDDGLSMVEPGGHSQEVA